LLNNLLDKFNPVHSHKTRVSHIHHSHVTHVFSVSRPFISSRSSYDHVRRKCKVIKFVVRPCLLFGHPNGFLGSLSLRALDLQARGQLQQQQNKPSRRMILGTGVKMKSYSEANVENIPRIHCYIVRSSVSLPFLSPSISI
jgi:hypothetical protein